MSEQQRLSIVAKDYLYRFYEILDEMITSMNSAELTDSISHNFIVQMIPHHMAAIQMSQNILQYTTCLPLQNIALNIINEQTKSIENMKMILCECSELEDTQQDLCLYQRCYQQIAQTMFAEMGDACASNNINVNFLQEMIPHHQGAIRMSENALRYNICHELVPILDAIIVSQCEGVREMECLLRCL